MPSAPAAQGAPAPAAPTAAAIKAAIAARARALGFDAVGFADADVGEGPGRALAAWLAEGMAGDMDWMARTARRRAAPRALWPVVETVIALGLNYGPPRDPLALLEHRARGNISVYARGRDYHKTVKTRLKALARFIAETFGAEVKVFVDTAPVMEKPAAARAGIGWRGKHTNLVSRDFGSWLLLGEVFTTLVLPPDPPGEDRCGRCRACLDVCPTGAFPAPYRLDARRCIAYLTIEHQGHIAPEFRAPIGNRVFGCDDCLAVCPWNKFARATREADLLPRAELTAPRLADLAALDEAAFGRVFAGTPVRRLGRARLLRNVLIAIGNAGEAGLVPTARARLADPSPLVRAMAVWALSRLLDADAFARLRATYAAAEPDAAVRGEWEAGPGAFSL